jgi:hypothetical protein
LPQPLVIDPHRSLAQKGCAEILAISNGDACGFRAAYGIKIPAHRFANNCSI